MVRVTHALVLSTLLVVSACTTASPVPSSTTLTQLPDPSVTPPELSPTTSTTGPASPTVPLADPAAPVLRIGSTLQKDSRWDGPGLLPMSLWRFHQPSGVLIPLLAAEAEPRTAVKEGSNWVVEVPLRDGVLWSDGVPPSGEDVLFTFKVFPVDGLTVESSSGLVRLVFDHRPGWTELVDVGSTPLLAAHYWQAQAEGPGEDELTDLMAPTAGGFRFAEAITDDSDRFGPLAVYVFEAVPTWWDRGSTYTSYPEGVRWLSPVLEIDEVFGEASDSVTAEWVNGPHVQRVEFLVYELGYSVIGAYVEGGVDAILEHIGFGLRTQSGLPLPGRTLLAPTSSIAVLIPEADAVDEVVWEALACQVDTTFLTQQVLQGAAYPVGRLVDPTVVPTHDDGNADFSTYERSGCAGLTDELRRQEAVRMLKADGYSWKTPLAEIQNDSQPNLTTSEGRTIPEMKIVAPRASENPLATTAALWLSAWGNDIGLPLRVNMVDAEGNAERDARDLPLFGEVRIIETGDWPDLSLAQELAAGGPQGAQSFLAALRAANTVTSYEAQTQAFRDWIDTQQSVMLLFRNVNHYLAWGHVDLPYENGLDAPFHFGEALEAIRVDAG